MKAKTGALLISVLAALCTLVAVGSLFAVLGYADGSDCCPICTPNFCNCDNNCEFGCISLNPALCGMSDECAGYGSKCCKCKKSPGG